MSLEMLVDPYLGEKQRQKICIIIVKRLFGTLIRTMFSHSLSVITFEASHKPRRENLRKYYSDQTLATLRTLKASPFTIN